MPPVIAFVGKSESGKTALLEKLIGELKRRGHRVLAIKHTKEDVHAQWRGKDSWKLGQAGSDAVVLSSPTGFYFFRPVSREPSLSELSNIMDGDYDIILAEGYKGQPIPRIEVHRKELGPDLVCSPGELTAVVSDSPLEVALPRYSPEDVVGIADFLEQRFLTPPEKEERVELSVDGAPVGLNPFARRMISGIMRSVVSTLQGVEQPSNIRLTMRRRKE